MKLDDLYSIIMMIEIILNIKDTVII